VGIAAQAAAAGEEALPPATPAADKKLRINWSLTDDPLCLSQGGFFVVARLNKIPL
jgi:putative oxidoreductase